MVLLNKEIMYIDNIDPNSIFFLAADIGGTNSNFGIFDIRENLPVLILSLHYKSQEISNFTDLFKQLLSYLDSNYKIKIERSCIGVAGVIQRHRHYVKPTNLNFIIDLLEIKKITNIKDIFLINDFEAVALGLELISPDKIITINSGKKILHANKAFLGAGTGLGKSILTWDLFHKKYIPIASEGGHSDLVIYNNQELNLLEYINKLNNCPVSWENILSGSGITNIYNFLGTIKNYKKTEATEFIAQHNFNPDKISYFAKEDPRCADTFNFYCKFYARCIKNFALEALSLSGIYIAGGIASKNVSIFFDPVFNQEFLNCGKQKNLLKEIPVYVITDYNISLYGAVIADQYHALNFL